jgi:Icc-related predicted phosphoesterase
MEEAMDGFNHVRIMDREVLEIGGIKIGFVSGAPPMPWTFDLPGVISEEVFNAGIETLGKVDILCSHVPPKVPELAYDMVAKRDEGGSSRLLEYIQDYQPSWVYYGHVHNPLKSSLTLGKSQLVNLACFCHHHRVHLHPLSEEKCCV